MSGKSTLVEDILHRALARRLYRARVIPGEHRAIAGTEHIDKVIDIDQSPIGRTPRSNPATYTGLFTPIRELFAELPDAKIRGASIADVLAMTVEEAHGFFENQPRVRQKLETLLDVGLGYIQIGQSATTLSGGEAQRVKLATELAKRDTGRTLYILDEPTTGLHFEDVRLLLRVLHRLVDKGNTVLVIEHNLDVIKTADWIVDLGPDGGAGGGQIVAAGTPEAVKQVKESHTGAFLRHVI